jgi:hypothetical protein
MSTTTLFCSSDPTLLNCGTRCGLAKTDAIPIPILDNFDLTVSRQTDELVGTAHNNCLELPICFVTDSMLSCFIHVEKTNAKKLNAATEITIARCLTFMANSLLLSYQKLATARNPVTMSLHELPPNRQPSRLSLS